MGWRCGGGGGPRGVWIPLYEDICGMHLWDHVHQSKYCFFSILGLRKGSPILVVFLFLVLRR